MTAGPFEWHDLEPTCAHAYVMPLVLSWLKTAGARCVLDLGCGNGALTARIAEQGIEVTGIDASASGIGLSRQNVPGATFIHASIDEPLPSNMHGRFDAVVAVEVIEHLLAPGTLCARAREGLARNGRLIVTTPYHGYLKNVALALAGRFDSHWHPERDGGHVKFFSRATLTTVIAREGFIVTRFARVGRIPVLAKSMVIEARVRS